MTLIALLGWLTAARLSKRAEMAEAMARYAEERQNILEMASQRIRLNEAAARREVAEALERADAHKTVAAALRLQISILDADLEAARAGARNDVEELYDSSTKRLKKFPSLAAKPDV